MGPAAAECVDPGLDDVFRRVEVRFADLQMDDVVPFGFESPCPYQNLESRLSTEPLHAVGEPEGKTGNAGIDVEIVSRGCHGAHHPGRTKVGRAASEERLQADGHR